MSEEKPIRAFRFAAAGRTDVGRQRKHNEDHLLVRSSLGLIVVADGMGGHNAGDVASALTTTSLDNYFRATNPGGPFLNEQPGDEALPIGARRLATAIRKANRDVHEISSTYQQHHGMGSTVVCAYATLDSGEIHIGHVGDSRCYRLRDGKLELLTRDHSLVNDALEIKPDLTEEEVARLPKNIITRALGMKDLVKVDVRTEPVKLGDLYLLCSDGLSGMIEDPDLERTLAAGGDIKALCEKLVRDANAAGGVDNITAAVVRIESPLDVATSAHPSIAPPAPKLPSDAHPPPAVIAPNDDVAVPDAAAVVPELARAAPGPVETVLGAPAPREDAMSSDEPLRIKAPAAPAHAQRSHEETLTSLPIDVVIARCKKCSSELMVGSIFCVDCGTPVD